jgi:hypothetical protein
MPGAYKLPPEQWTDPEWEAIAAYRRPISPTDAVRECAELTEIWRHTGGGKWAIKVDPFDIIRALNARKIPFVLTGTHGISTWTGRPRATLDVDILVKGGRNLSRAVNAVRDLFPQLETRVFAGVTGFFVPGTTQSLIDVTYPHRADLAETLAHPVWTEDNGQRYRIPALEAALANKYGAMLTPTRNLGKRQTDIGDFTTMVLHSQDPGQPAIDLQRLAELGELVWPGGGGAEVLRLIELVQSGRGFGLYDLIRTAP